MRTLVLCVPALLLVISCAHSGGGVPVASPADVASMKSLERIMKLQSSKVGPVLGKHSQTSFTPGEIDMIKTAAQYVSAVGTRIQRGGFKRTFDGGFNMFAAQLKSDGDKLGAAATGGNAQAIASAIKTLRATCKACHVKYQKH